ncbi:zinc ribbon domain-containing protein [Candidatus Fermentibacteria bacterium]|nr:zinc ribbon domain-containing protein [Candidatus Fermentibacteria bacterium]
MPLYEYVCSECGAEAEFLVGYNDQDERECPECGGKMERVFSVFRAENSDDSQDAGSCPTGTCPLSS